MHRRTGWAAAGRLAVAGVRRAVGGVLEVWTQRGSVSVQRGPSQSSAAADRLPAAIADVMNTYTTLGDNVRAIIVNVNGRTRFERYYSSSSR